jgi:hypothetical protein
MGENAKLEMIRHIGERVVLCAKVTYGRDYCDNRKVFVLGVGHTPADRDAFFQSLDFVYDDGYGSQELYGNIWYDDGTWSDRGEYDGSEWWQYQSVPEIPEECRAKQ